MIYLYLTLLLNASAQQPPNDGSVCLHSYSPKIMAFDDEKRITVAVDDSEKFAITPIPRVLMSNLATDKPHKVTIFDGDKSVASLDFKFPKKSKAPMMNIKRKAGYWYTDVNPKRKCASAP